MDLIFNKIEESYKRNLPFVAYRKPNKVELSSLFMNTDELHFSSDFTECGFVFSPFDSNENTILFPLENAEFITKKISYDDSFTCNDSFASASNNYVDREKHICLVEKALDKINYNELKKVVVSREEEVILTSFDLLVIFKKLLIKYINAFVYVWYHPKVGLWFGASPETLLSISDANFRTMSLAGTQVYKANEVVWKKKEREEQQLVTSFIENQLESLSNNLSIDKAETIKAGNLLHLRTSVKGTLNTSSSIKELIRALHPTPAVCGLPRETAKKFIQQNENYKRTFYTGFLGELNIKNQYSSLFVNLRCMCIEGEIAIIYVGGGITKDSNAKKEWEETIAKSKTMKKVL
ncbi:MAG: chorismate-binding protein [Polaribacter sp.]|jgi:isochorismate synthase|nr:chorismate-binding protein [Polaribacter sp.]MDG2357573.1 chorismate-binding protein [Polaribacter sp.]